MRERASVLLVEDDENDVIFVSRAVRKQNLPCDLSVASDGRRALERLAADGWAPDLVVLDVKLPGWTGFDLLERIRAFTWMRGVPVVVFSSSSEPRDLEESRRLGVSAYVQKPDELNEFQNVFGQIFLHWGLRQPGIEPPRDLLRPTDPSTGVGS